MRVLLDESVPRQLAPLLSSHSVSAVPREGWAGLDNGELLDRAVQSPDVLDTGQQNLDPGCERRKRQEVIDPGANGGGALPREESTHERHSVYNHQLCDTRHPQLGAQEMCRALSRSPALPFCSRHRVSRRGALPATMPVTVMSRTAEPQVCRLRSAALRDRHDVVDLQEEARAAAPPGMPVDVAAAA